ncbi:hypothetical protein Mro02_16070 [Microbispora rosea subsp. aerata]|nr:hypothetical protein Mro02_16070 [Microbispora rosea subsp. aerata]GLJ85784.1 hypothetical protein GCM10017588_45170 [Microbispora rosea subsp. aerata]
MPLGVGDGLGDACAGAGGGLCGTAANDRAKPTPQPVRSMAIDAAASARRTVECDTVLIERMISPQTTGRIRTAGAA